MKHKTIDLNVWLRKHPQPVAVMLDGSRRIALNGGGRQWRDMVATLNGLTPTPSKLEALDAKGEVLRAIDLGGKVVKDEDEDEETAGGKSDLQVFANLLADATKDQPIMKHMMEFIDRQSQRLAQADREVDKLREDNAKLRAHVLELTVGGGSEEGSDPVTQLVSAFTAGRQQTAVVRAVPATAPKVEAKKP